MERPAWRQHCSETLQLQSPVGFRKVGDIIVSNRTHVLLWKDLYHLHYATMCKLAAVQGSPCDHCHSVVKANSKKHQTAPSVNPSMAKFARARQIPVQPPCGMALNLCLDQVDEFGGKIARNAPINLVSVTTGSIKYLTLTCSSLPCVLFLLAGCCSVAYGSVNYPESNE